MRFKYKRSEYKIDVDRYQYSLCKRLKDHEDGSEQWEVYGYYSDVYYLLLKLLRIGLIDQKDCKDIRQMIQDSLQLLTNTLEKALPKPYPFEDTVDKVIDKYQDALEDLAKR